MAPTLACHVLVVIFVEAKLISKTSEFFFGTYGLFMVREKVEEVLFWFRTYQKWFVIREPESLNSIVVKCFGERRGEM